MMGLNGYLLCLAFLAAALLAALNGSWWHAAVCLALAIAVFVRWPFDFSTPKE